MAIQLRSNQCARRYDAPVLRRTRAVFPALAVCGLMLPGLAFAQP